MEIAGPMCLAFGLAILFAGLLLLLHAKITHPYTPSKVNDRSFVEMLYEMFRNITYKQHNTYCYLLYLTFDSILLFDIEVVSGIIRIITNS